MDLLTR